MRALLLFAFAATLPGDGGGIVAQGQAGPWRVTLFSNPYPVRAGAVQLGVLVQTPGTLQPVLDAKVRVIVVRSGSTSLVSLEATNRENVNRLLYGVRWNVTAPGPCQVVIAIEQGSVKAQFPVMVTALDAPEAMARFIACFAVVPVGILVFALNRVLRGKYMESRHRSPCR